jgi:hypothetical protein
MKRSRFSEEQIIGILKEHQAGLPAAELGSTASATPAFTIGFRLDRILVGEAIHLIEAAGIVQRVRHLVRRVINFGGIARLSTVQSTSLYSFAERMLKKAG